MKIQVSMNSNKTDAQQQIKFNKRLIGHHEHHLKDHEDRAKEHHAAGNKIRHFFHKNLANYHRSEKGILERSNKMLSRKHGLDHKHDGPTFIGWKRSGSPAYSSTSSAHGRRRARLVLAMEQQKTHHKISDFVEVLADPDFDRYYKNQFQAFLKSKSAVDSLSDKDEANQAYLDVVGFLNSMLAKHHPNLEVKEDRSKMSFIGHRNPNRMGDRRHITYSVNVKSSV